MTRGFWIGNSPHLKHRHSFFLETPESSLRVIFERPRNDLLRVEWDVKPYTLTHSLTFERTLNITRYYRYCQVLNVSFNRLEQFPDDLTLLYHLVELNMAGNNLRQLPKDIKKLRSLTSLDVSDNLIDQLPDQLIKLPSLQRLNIADNIIMQWPSNFVKLQAKVEV